MTEPIVKPQTYLWVFAALIALTGVTVGLAYVDLGRAHTLVGLSIALVKGVLILAFFMHWIHSYAMNRIAALAGILWLSILIGLSLSDFLTRDWPMSSFWEGLMQIYYPN